MDSTSVDEESFDVSRKTRERRDDRKLKNDITKILYRLEMDSVKPSFEVLMTAGLHRGLYQRSRRRALLEAGDDLIEKKNGTRASRSRAGQLGGFPDSQIHRQDKPTKYKRQEDKPVNLSSHQVDDFLPSKYHTMRSLSKSPSEFSPEKERLSQSAHRQPSPLAFKRNARNDLHRTSPYAPTATYSRPPRDISLHDSAAVANNQNRSVGSGIITLDELPYFPSQSYDYATASGVRRRSPDALRMTSGEAKRTRPISLQGDQLIKYLNEEDAVDGGFRLESAPRNKQPTDDEDYLKEMTNLFGEHHLTRHLITAQK